jgi:hypothetical protein
MSDLDLGGTATPTNNAAPTTETTTTNTQTFTFPDNWKDYLDEDIKKDPSMEAIKDIKNLAKSYVHGKRMLGAEKIPVPGKNATEDDWANVYKKLGLPDPDKYDVKFPETYDQEFTKSLKETLHKAGVLPKQAQTLVDFYNNYATEAMKRAEESQTLEKTKQFDTLKKEWGDAFNKNVEVAKHTFQKFVDKDTMQYLNDSGFTKDPVVFKVFAKIGEMLGEDKVVDPKGSGGFSPVDLQAKIDTLMSDPAYFSKSHPNHNRVVEEAQKYFQMMERMR